MRSWTKHYKKFNHDKRNVSADGATRALPRPRNLGGTYETTSLLLTTTARASQSTDVSWARQGEGKARQGTTPLTLSPSTPHALQYIPRQSMYMNSKPWHW